MQIPLVIWFLIAGVAHSSENPCDIAKPEWCFTELTTYESLTFPLFGQDSKLDDVCGNIQQSFNCINDFASNCRNTSICNTECEDLISEISGFSKTTGLSTLAAELCNKDSVFRAAYHESYHCLEKNAEPYEVCHNVSQMSLSHLSTVRGPDAISQRCCYFSWIEGCFTNVTRDTCDEKGTYFVDNGIKMLIGRIAHELCSDYTITCDRAPLPPDSNGAEATDKTDEKQKPGTPGPHEEKSVVVVAGATIRSGAVDVMLLAYCMILLFKYIL